MSNKNNTYKKSRISGVVSYLNAQGRRVRVPPGPCEISDNDGFGPFFLRWMDGDGYIEIELTLNEFSQYSNTKDFVILES